MLPDLNRLRVFCHIYSERGVSNAAATLHVTQSAVSQSLSKLEAELDSQLFVRAGRGLVATPAARALFDMVAPFLAELERGVDQLHRNRRELVGTARIGAPAELGAGRLPRMLAEFRARNPAARFELHLGHPFETLPMLERGELDLVLADVFAAREPKQVGLAVEPLLDEQLLLVGSKKYLRSVEQTDTVPGLCEASYIAYRPRAPAVHSWFAHHFRTTALTLDIGLTVESVQAVVSAISAHMGLGVVPGHVVAAQLKRGTLIAIPGKRKPVVNRIALVRLLDRVPTTLERAVTAHLRAGLSGEGSREQ